MEYENLLYFLVLKALSITRTFRTAVSCQVKQQGCKIWASYNNGNCADINIIPQILVFRTTEALLHICLHHFSPLAQCIGSDSDSKTYFRPPWFYHMIVVAALTRTHQPDIKDLTSVRGCVWFCFKASPDKDWKVWPHISPCVIPRCKYAHS